MPAITQVAAARSAVESVAEADAAPVSSDALTFELPTGSAPWAEAEDIREKRRLRALARKALRATRRAAAVEED